MAALDSRSMQRVTLYWGGRTPEDCYASGLLNALQGKDGVFRWHPVVSGDVSADGSHTRYVQDVAAEAGHDWSRTMVYACGNGAMVRAAQARLREMGLPEGRFQSEAFLPSGSTGPVRASAGQPLHPWERVSERFTLDGILDARRRSMDAVREIAALMTPGITTGEAIALADQHLQRMGASHNWHPTYIRFGPDSQSPAVQPTDRSRTLGENDIFVVDIGPVWDGYEGDYGDTFVTGADADQQRCAQAARDVFQRARLACLCPRIRLRAGARYRGASGIGFSACAVRQAPPGERRLHSRRRHLGAGDPGPRPGLTHRRVLRGRAAAPPYSAPLTA
ncbi:hypothetical protein G6F65_017371 [Rhizopus arrhizus]|nr:hypothetical protein G6F65_017371 [Rhizopus arrhizus]